MATAAAPVTPSATSAIDRKKSLLPPNQNGRVSVAQGRTVRNATRGSHPRGVLGVWSPFGQAYACHGEVALKLGKKPQRPGGEHHAKPPTDDSLPPIVAHDEEMDELEAPPPPPGPPVVLKPGLGLGLGLHPQRFPRELLQSSEQRVRACGASFRRLDGLGTSASDPSLMVRRRNQNASSVSAAGGGGAAGAAGGSSAADWTNSIDSYSCQLIERPQALPPLPAAVRYAAEFKGVQRQSRLRLEAMLEERARLRSSVWGLKAAQVAVSPMVIARYDAKSTSQSLTRLGGRTLWHEASRRIDQNDGGHLRLWQELHAHLLEYTLHSADGEIPNTAKAFMEEVNRRLSANVSVAGEAEPSLVEYYGVTPPTTRRWGWEPLTCARPAAAAGRIRSTRC